MQFKCYFHPKAEGADLCRGCKLPICAPCKHELGFCPDCMRKRDAVDDLRELRKAAASKSRVASSTTARLRLAIRQVGPIAKRGRLIDTQLLGTGPLVNPDKGWQEAAMAVNAKVPTHVKETVAQRRSQWTYDPDRVAYKGVQGAASQPRKAPTPRTSVAGRIRRPAAQAYPADAAWTRPFAMGLAVGLVVVLLATFGQGWAKGAGKAKSKPILSNDTAAEIALVRRVTGTDEASQRSRAKAAARRALMAQAFAEGNAVANRAAASAAAAPRYYRAAAPVRASRPAAPAAPAAAPVAPAVRFERPAPAPRAVAFHALPMPRLDAGSPRGISSVRSTTTWQKSSGTLVTTW
jgi:hypothetical protein